MIHISMFLMAMEMVRHLFIYFIKMMMLLNGLMQ